MSQNLLAIGNICAVCSNEIPPQSTGGREEVESRCSDVFHSGRVGEYLNRDVCPTCIRNPTSEASENVVREEYIVISGLGSDRIIQ